LSVKQYWILPIHEKTTIIQAVAPPKSYSFDPESDFFTCSYCGGTGLFPDGNGGIMHEVGCLASLSQRLGVAAESGVAS